MTVANGQSGVKTPARPRVVVLGGGFAGLNAALALGEMAVDATLIDRRNHHTFQPLLYQVAVGVLSPASRRLIGPQCRRIFRSPSARFCGTRRTSKF